MNKIYIKSISINGFRGINNEKNPLVIPFNVNGVTSIFAENGIGKSSVFEALYYCINGYLPKFDTLHREIRDDKTKKNLFHKGQGLIKISFVDEMSRDVTIHFEINEKGERNVSWSSISNPKGFLDKIRCEHNFLDYNSFTQIIVKSPEETGKLFSDLVGYKEFPHLREKIDKITRTQNINTDFQKNSNEQTIKNDETYITAAKIQVLDVLTELGLEIKSFDLTDIIKLIKKYIKKEFKTTIGKIDNIQFDQLIKNKVGASYDKDVEMLNQFQTQLLDLNKFKKSLTILSKKSFTGIQINLEKASSKFGSMNDLCLNELFEKALIAYDNIPNFDKNDCILCKTKEVGSDNSFYNFLNEQIKSFVDLKAEINKISTFLKKKIQEENLLEIEKCLSDIGFIGNQECIFSKIYHSSDNIDFKAKSLIDLISLYKSGINGRIKEVISNIKILNGKVPKELPGLIQKNLKTKEIVDSLILIRDKEIKIRAAKKYLFELDKWIEFSATLKLQFENAFNDLMTDIASDIDKQTKEYFSLIMKNKEISPLIRKDNKGQKVNILIDKFYTINQENNATPLLSESYRNALCLSIYFASALKNSSKGNFIILDDITSSFDSGHQFFLLYLIKDKISSIANKQGKQIIMLTHDGLLKKTIGGFQTNNKNWTHYSLWGNKDELSLKAFEVDDYKRLLIEKINKGDSIGSDLRAYYEFVLMDIIEKLDLPIPISIITNPDKKLIENLLNSITEIIELKRKSTRKIIKTLPTKNDFKNYIQQIGNNLSHFSSSSSSSLSPSVLTAFADSIVDIQRKFQYQCTCSCKQGWIYYKTIGGGKRNKSCSCVF
jgi:hypothetical protein